MPYSTPLMVREALAPGLWASDPVPDPANPTGTAADLDDTQLADAIAEADSTINTFLSGRYDIPFKPQIPPGANDLHPIDYWSRNIAAYNATLTYRGSQDFSEQDPIARRYNATMVALTATRDGKATVPFPENLGPGSQAAAGTVHNPYVGDLFGTDDFSLVPVGGAYPNMRPYYPADYANWYG